MIRFKVSPKMAKYLKDHPYMEPHGLQEADPKKGTGKKPKGSGRRLYTDENPKDTVSVKFSTVQDIKDTLSKSSFKSKSHKRQSQIINLIHQRARAAYQNAKDPKVKKRLKKAYDYATERKEASKRKTKRMQKVNEEVKKIIAYHGSNVPIRKFSTEYGAQGVIWFTQDRNEIISGLSGALSSNYIMKVELDVDKVAGWPEYDKLFLKQIEDQGYDSIKLDNNWVIFDPKRIKVLQIEQRKKINEEEPFQKAVKKNYRKMKIRLIGKGGNKYVSPGMTKPSYDRAKSAPPGFGGSLEEAAEEK